MNTATTKCPPRPRQCLHSECLQEKRREYLVPNQEQEPRLYALGRTGQRRRRKPEVELTSQMVVIRVEIFPASKKCSRPCTK